MEPSLRPMVSVDNGSAVVAVSPVAVYRLTKPIETCDEGDEDEDDQGATAKCTILRTFHWHAEHPCHSNFLCTR